MSASPNADSGRVIECDDPECVYGCQMADLPAWLLPYRCQHVTDEERRIRDALACNGSLSGGEDAR